MSQPIIVPTRCLGCKSERVAIQDGTAYYACGTTLRTRHGRVKVTRTSRCVERIPTTRAEAIAEGARA